MSDDSDLLDQAIIQRDFLARIIAQRTHEHANLTILCNVIAVEICDLNLRHDELRDAITDYHENQP